MPAAYDELRTTIIASLQELSEASERVYLSMGDTYPVLIQEMRKSLQSNEDQDIPVKLRQDMGDKTLLKLIDDTRTFVLKSNEGFSADHLRDTGLHTELQEQLSHIGSLGVYIERIRDDSSAMELISLNAMTVALKAGNQGRAFSYITDELKRLSSRTIDLTTAITRRGGILMSLFAEFQQNLQRIGEQEQAIFGAFMQRMDSIFSDFSEGVTSVIREVMETRRRSEKVLPPLMSIMTELQGQDLIRQSIEHIILSLNEIRSTRDPKDIERSLDELSFLEILPDLSINVLSEIASRIKHNKINFETNIREAESLISQLEEERARFIRVNVEHAGNGSLEQKFNNSKSMLENLLSDMEALNRSKENVVERSRELQREVKELDETFKSFGTIIMRFRTIDVASRIEIAKQEVLFQMKGTVNEMTSLTQQIEDDVDKSLSITSAFLAGTHRILENYRRAHAVQHRNSRQFIDQLKHMNHKMHTAKNDLVNSIVSFQVFTRTFSETFSRNRSDLDGLRKLLHLIDEQKVSLRLIKKSLAEEKRLFMAEHHVHEWKLENQKLRSMIDRFTILTHKKYAGELGGFAVEEGARSGDITLF